MSATVEGYYTPAEFCALYGISKRTLSRYVRKGKVPVVRLSKRLIRIPESAVRIIAERRAAA